MSVIFIDLGCSDGRTVEAALNGRDGLPQLRYDKIYAFDAIRDPSWLDAKWKSCEVEFYECAVGVSRGFTWLTMTENPEARTAIPNNKNYEESGALKKRVKVINFIEWFREHVNFEDTIVLKMDIEGAEYELLEYMIDRGCMDYVNHLFVEFHSFCVKDDLVEEYKEREKKIRESCPVEIGVWL